MDNALGKCLFCLYSLVSILVFYQGVSVESQSYPLGHRMQSKVKCLRLEKPWHGKYIDLYNTPIEQPFLPLYTILWYSCDEGYELFPKNTLLICLRDGTWSQDPPTCSSKLVNNNVDFGFRKNLAEGKCQQLEEPAHGKYVDLFNSSLGQTYFPLNSILWYVCDKGYHLNPRNIILICLKDGSWSRDPPTCSTDCSLPKETGTCKDFKIKWHFDLEFGGCSTFWYGGCEGNENRFNSKDECESICVEPIGTGVCGLPRVSGPCVAQILAWYYDVGLNKCEPFNYSGCLGNNNNFHTRTACEDLCNIRAGLCPPLHSTTITKVRCFDNDNIEIKCDEATNNSSAKFECATYYELANRQLPIRHCWSGTWNLPPPLCIPGKSVCFESVEEPEPVASTSQEHMNKKVKESLTEYPAISNIAHVGVTRIDQEELKQNLESKESLNEYPAISNIAHVGVTRIDQEELKQNPESKASQTSQILSCGTPRKVQLRKRIKSLKRKMNTSQESNTQTAMTIDNITKFLGDHVSSNLANFLKTQITLAKKKPKGSRYSNEYKQFALTIHFLGPKVYKFLSKMFRLLSRSTLQRITAKWDIRPVCGENNLSTKPVILNGTTVEKENYPWVAAVFKKTENGFINSCGGSMLTQKVILTAANCVANIYGNKLDESEFKVGVGKYYRKYKDERDTQAQYSDVQQIWVHPRYKGDSLRYSSDIAILVTKDTLSLSKVVQPVCFSNLPGIHLTARSEGMVTGWGIITPARGPSEELKSIAVPYKDDVACSKELPSDWLDKYNGYDKFCAGHHNKSIAVCMGDSGGGLVFKNPRDSRFYIHGIASLGRKLNNSGCDIQVSTLYTNVAVHYELLKEIISRKTSQ